MKLERPRGRNLSLYYTPCFPFQSFLLAPSVRASLCTVSFYFPPTLSFSLVVPPAILSSSRDPFVPLDTGRPFPLPLSLRRTPFRSVTLCPPNLFQHVLLSLSARALSPSIFRSRRPLCSLYFLSPLSFFLSLCSSLFIRSAVHVISFSISSASLSVYLSFLPLPLSLTSSLSISSFFVPVHLSTAFPLVCTFASLAHFSSLSLHKAFFLLRTGPSFSHTLSFSLHLHYRSVFLDRLPRVSRSSS